MRRHPITGTLTVMSRAPAALRGRWYGQLVNVPLDWNYRRLPKYVRRTTAVLDAQPTPCGHWWYLWRSYCLRALAHETGMARFSLRTLLIATTLVAVVLGLIVAVV